MTAENNILNLASKYSLEKGKYADYYELHTTWCLTKRGAGKIREAERVVYTMPEADITPVSIAYRATFSIPDEAGALTSRVHVVGSCRWDGGKRNPEATHAPEMAWKRMLVRGTIEVLGSAGAGIYGDEEFDADFHARGTATQAAPPPQRPPAERPHEPALMGLTPAQAPPPAENPDGTINPDADPRLAKCLGAPGWFDSAKDLPKEWNQAMAKFCDITHEERGTWEKRLLDHCGKFEGSNGWWRPSPKYPNYADIVYALDPKTGKSKAGFAINIIKSMREVLGELESTGHTVLNVPDGQDGSSSLYEIYKHGEGPGVIAQGFAAKKAKELAEQLATEQIALDDIPF